MNLGLQTLAGLVLGITSLAAQAPSGRQQVGCPNQPITLRLTMAGNMATLQPIPQGYGQVTGFFLLWAPNPLTGQALPPVRQLLPFGQPPYAPCCNPGPAVMYDFLGPPVISPNEAVTIPVPREVVGSGIHVWVQELMWRPPQGVPCQTYVTNSVEIIL